MSARTLKERNRAGVIASIIQVVVSGLVFFVLFRYLFVQIGIEQIGVWSLVLATTSVSRIGELGLSAGVVRFVAQARAHDDEKRAENVVQTVAIALSVFMGALLLALYPLCVFFLGRLISPNNFALAVSILPYALTSLWVMVLVSVFSGALDGCQRVDLRCIVMGASHLGYLGLVFVLTPKYGLKGVAVAQLCQSIGLLVASWLTLKFLMQGLPAIPLHWNKGVLREMMGYGVSFQFISIMNMLFDPVAKALMGKYGGLQSLGYYEMANKLILQGRAVIVEASRVLVPSIASLKSIDVEEARQLFAKSYKITFYVAVLFYGLLGISLTAICLIWLGRYERVFIQFALVLDVAWFVNTLIGPAYFSNLGSGALRANLVSHVIMGLVASLLGYQLGVVFGRFGVVMGTALGLISGSLFLSISHIRASGFDWRRFIVPSGMTGLSLLAPVLVLVSNGYGFWNPATIAVLCVGIACGMILIVMGWTNPMRKLLVTRGSQ
jgi:O-antigen/teichoic acid export membrane protein